MPVEHASKPDLDFVSGGQKRSSAAEKRADEFIRRAEETRHPFDPELTLFVDDSTRSRRAQDLLHSAGQQFRTLPATGRQIPTLVFGGVVAERLSGIARALRALNAFDAALGAGMAAREARRPTALEGGHPSRSHLPPRRLS